MSDQEARARAVPAREAILWALPLDGAMSVRELREALPGLRCAEAGYHLHVLAKAGLAERADGGWRRRSA
jgi:DNA-binding transcriptional ArsR family regulator